MHRSPWEGKIGLIGRLGENEDGSRQGKAKYGGDRVEIKYGERELELKGIPMVMCKPSVVETS